MLCIMSSPFCHKYLQTKILICHASKMAGLESIALSNKFRGCLTGALLGDCLGAVYEGEEEVSKCQVQQYFDKLDGPYFKSPYKPYTDDTAMTIGVAESLLEYNGFNDVGMAKHFVRNYFQHPNRGYGSNVATVFAKLRGSKFADPFGPSREQFNGVGSYGNGAAMRVSPVALFCHSNVQALMDTAIKSAELTHSNKLGMNGAVLQALAVHKGLTKDPTKEPLNVKEFVNELITEMKSFETEDDLGIKQDVYDEQLNMVKSLLEKGEESSDEMVVNQLGNNISAVLSVPTAIYCFLRAQSSIPGVNTENSFRRTIQYAVTLGGDTDTIASMAGAIAGAYYGYDAISPALQRHCEGVDHILSLADRLYETAAKTT